MNVVLQNGGFLLEKISIMKCHEKRRSFNRELPSFTKFLLTAFFSVCRGFGSLLKCLAQILTNMKIGVIKHQPILIIKGIDFPIIISISRLKRSAP